MKLFRAQEVYRILLIAGMMAALASAAGDVARRLAPDFDPRPLVGLSFLVVLEGVATERLARRTPEAQGRLRLRAAEWVVILLLLRLGLSLVKGTQALAQDVARWTARPQSLLDLTFVLAALLLLVVYILGGELSRQLEALDADIPASPPNRQSAANYAWVTRPQAAYYAWLTHPQMATRSDPWRQLIRTFLIGGLILLVASGLARTDLAEAVTLSNPALAGIVANALVYFGLGLALLAQGQYARLHTRWRQDGVLLAQPLARRWLALALGFVGLAAVAVLFLPVRPSLAVLVAAVKLIVNVVSWLFEGIAFVISSIAYLVSLLLRLLGTDPGRAATEQQPAPPQVPQMPAPVANGQSGWQNIQGLVVSVLVLGIIIFALVRFVRDRRDLWRELRRQGKNPLGWLARLFGGAWHWLVRARRQVAVRLRTAWMRRTPVVSTTRRRFLWFRPRSPREEVRLLYLLGLHQGERQGYVRRPADTPFEHAQRMAETSPETDPELRVLTQGFVAARYGRREFTAVEVNPLRAAYRRLRQAWLLRGKDKGGPAA